jgi:hypothetical protein
MEKIIMENQYIGTCHCFLCNKTAMIKPNTDGAYHFVDCPNCGQYKLSEAAFITKAYISKNRFLVAGEVFKSYYYKNEIKLVTAEDFTKEKFVSYSEKLFNLAKYFYTETKKNETYIIQRPSSCYEDIGERYGRLMNELKRLNIITYTDAIDDDEDFTSHFIELHLTVQAIIKFEKGINTLEEFMEAFMDGNSKANKINVNIKESTNSLVNVATDGSIIKAEQNNNPDLKEILKLLDDLMPQIPNDVSAEIKQQVADSISVIKSELEIQTPKKNVIKTLLAGMKGLVSATGFLASILKILDFLAKI